MSTNKTTPSTNPSPERLERKVTYALELLVRVLGLVNGTITIHARGGQLCRGIEVINRVDVATLD